jgi:hypothetical protein
MGSFTFGIYIYLLIILGAFSFIFYVLFTVLKSMKLRNEYLKDIRDELRKTNNEKND